MNSSLTQSDSSTLALPEPWTRRRRPVRLDGVSIVVAAAIFIILNGIFIIDMLLPLGVGISVGYVLAVALSARLRLARAPTGVAAVATLLTIAGAVLSPHAAADPAWVIIVNRGMTLLAVWMTALYLFARLRSGELRLRLAEREHALGAMIDHALDAVICIDADGTITDFNPRAELTFDLRRDEAVGSALEERLIPPRRRAAIATALEAIALGEHSDLVGAAFEFDVLKSDGSEMPVMMVILPPLTDVSPVTIVIRDSTDQRETRQHAERIAEELDARNQDLEELVSIIAHDLKRPLVSISGLLSMVKEDAGSGLDAESVENLDHAIAECRRMHAMVSDLSALTKFQRAGLEFEAIDLPRLVDAVVREAEPLAGRREATIEVDCDKAEVRLSVRHVQECLTNLVENALKYGCPQPGMRVRMTGRVAEGMVRLSVADDGPGMSAEEKSRIFELFRRGAAGGAGGEPGSGVGLFAVRRLIQQVGGTIAVDSDPGRGARFTMTVPVRV